MFAFVPVGLISGVFLLAVLCLTVALFVIHLRQWKAPFLQKLYLRIGLVPFVFAWMAWLSLYFPDSFFAFDALRHVYEGYALFAFASLMILYVGGDTIVEDKFREVR